MIDTSHAWFVYAGKIKVRYFLNRPRICSPTRNSSSDVMCGRQGTAGRRNIPSSESTFNSFSFRDTDIIFRSVSESTSYRGKERDAVTGIAEPSVGKGLNSWFRPRIDRVRGICATVYKNLFYLSPSAWIQIRDDCHSQMICVNPRDGALDS
jgi:hypothetical protein